MAVAEIEVEQWRLSPLAFLLLFVSCFISLFSLPYFSKKHQSSSSSPFDAGPTTPFLRFQRRFLILYSLSSVMQGLEPVLGEEEFVNYVIGREEMVMYLAAGAAAALFLGSVSGMVSDIV